MFRLKNILYMVNLFFFETLYILIIKVCNFIGIDLGQILLVQESIA